MAAKTEMSQAGFDVLAERQRQINGEGWTPEHDNEHDGGCLASAASAYAIYAADELDPRSQGDGQFSKEPPNTWPWHEEIAGRGEGPLRTRPVWWKPVDPRRALVKAGALILAEIERLDRLNK